MKQLLLFFSLLAVFFSLNSCKTPYKTSAESWMIRESKDVIVIGAKGYGNNERSALLDAEKRAFETLFYHGIPNSSYRRPLLENGRQDEAKVRQLFSSNDYRNYITNSNIISDLTRNKTKGTKELNAEVLINVFSLKRQLQEDEIIHGLKL
jgi:hypothetical protein